ncbi:MAG: DUF222 domain-containing protein [Actinobacteria bacterium]|nr:DUF222 domain-containing protein [Actinomycetota bacterium]
MAVAEHFGAELDAAEAAVDVLALCDPGAMADAELSEALVTLARLRSRLAGVEARLTGAWDARGVWAGDDARSGAAWLSVRCGVPARSARAQVSLSRQLRAMPATEEALCSGEVGAAQARRLGRACRRPPRSSPATRASSSTTPASSATPISNGRSPTGNSSLTPIGPSGTPPLCTTPVPCISPRPSRAPGRSTAWAIPSGARSWPRCSPASTTSSSRPTGPRPRPALATPSPPPTWPAPPPSAASTPWWRWPDAPPRRPPTARPRGPSSPCSSTTRPSPGGCASWPTAPWSRPAISFPGSVRRTSSGWSSTGPRG